MKRILALIASIFIAGTVHADCASSLGINFAPNQTVALCSVFGSAIQGSLIPGADNTYDVGSSTLGWRTGYFDTSVITPLVSSAAGLTLRADADANRILTWDASSDTAMTLTYGDTTAAQSLAIIPGTADAADTSTAYLGGGGSNSSSRGGFVQVYGNEHASIPGRVIVSSGLLGTGITLVTNSNTGDIALNVDNPNGTKATTFRASDGAQIYTSASQIMAAGTSDTADTSRLNLAGGGAAADTRGSWILLNGNEQGSTPGELRLLAGNVGSAPVTIYTGGALSWTFGPGGQAVSAGTSSIGWSVVAGANTACNTTCASGCVVGQNSDAANIFVGCGDAAADVCLCAGAS